MAVTIFEEIKISEQALFFLKIHSALTVAPTENLMNTKLQNVK